MSPEAAAKRRRGASARPRCPPPAEQWRLRPRHTPRAEAGASHVEVVGGAGSRGREGRGLPLSGPGGSLAPRVIGGPWRRGASGARGSRPDCGSPAGRGAPGAGRGAGVRRARERRGESVPSGSRLSPRFPAVIERWSGFSSLRSPVGWMLPEGAPWSPRPRHV